MCISMKSGPVACDDCYLRNFAYLCAYDLLNTMLLATNNTSLREFSLLDRTIYVLQLISRDRLVKAAVRYLDIL